MTIRLWQLGLVAVAALFAIAAFAGYSLAPKPGAVDTSPLVRRIAQRDAEIASLQTQLSTRQQQAPAAATVPATVLPARARAPRTPPRQRASSDRVAKSATLANVRSVLSAIESYNVDNIPGTPARTDPDFATSGTDSGYAGETAAGLRLLYDTSFPSTVWVSPSDRGFPEGVAGVIPTATTYCAVSKIRTWYSWKLGPAGLFRSSQSPWAVCKS